MLLMCRNLNSLGLLRHFARVGSCEALQNGEQPREAHENSRAAEVSSAQQVGAHCTSVALDYRYQPDQSEVRQDNMEILFLVRILII